MPCEVVLQRVFGAMTTSSPQFPLSPATKIRLYYWLHESSNKLTLSRRRQAKLSTNSLPSHFGKLDLVSLPPRYTCAII